MLLTNEPYCKVLPELLMHSLKMWSMPLTHIQIYSRDLCRFLLIQGLCYNAFLVLLLYFTMTTSPRLWHLFSHLMFSYLSLLSSSYYLYYPVSTHFTVFIINPGSYKYIFADFVFKFSYTHQLFCNTKPHPTRVLPNNTFSKCFYLH